MTDTADAKAEQASDGAFEPQIQATVDAIRQEVQKLTEQAHPKLVELIEVLDAAKLRQLANIEIRHQLAINHAKQTLKFTQQQIETDYIAGKDDIKEKVYSELRKKKKDVKDVVDKQMQRGQNSTYENNLLNDLKIPNKKKDKKSFKGTYNFKLPEQEAKQDLALIATLAEELDQGKK